MNVIFIEDLFPQYFYPFALTRPVEDIRIGILTIREKWEKMLNITTSSSIVKKHLREKFPAKIEDDNILINGRILPDANIVKKILNLPENCLLSHNNTTIAMRLNRKETENFYYDRIVTIPNDDKYDKEHILRTITDIFLKNDFALRQDFALITNGRKSAAISSTNTIIGDASNIFLEEGAVVEGAMLNCKEGPIYIGKNAEIMEGALIRGPFALCDHAQVKMGAKIYGATTIGPYCKVGGELNNVIFFGYSNKAHDGFLGNSVIGEWCNLGANTNASNLKNNYANINLWHHYHHGLVKTDLQFCGLFMGDYSKCGINSMFNSGTVVGVSANLFGSGYHKVHIPSFTYGGPNTKYDLYAFDKAIEAAKRMCARRNKTFTDVDKELLKSVLMNPYKD